MYNMYCLYIYRSILFYESIVLIHCKTLHYMAVQQVDQVVFTDLVGNCVVLYRYSVAAQCSCVSR